MRKLMFKDCLALARVMRKTNISDQLSEIAEKSKDKGVNIQKVGAKAVFAMFESCGDEEAEKEIYKLLGDIFEADVEHMPINEVIESFKKLAAENNLMGFFRQASQLIQ
jgi:hypothetical protein